MGLEIPNWLPLPKGLGLNDLLEWERQVYTTEEWLEVAAIAKDYEASLTLLVNGRMYSAPVTLFGFVDFDATFAEGIRVTGLYGPYQFLLGDQKGNHLQHLLR
jgi:hypothetical protein